MHIYIRFPLSDGVCDQISRESVHLIERKAPNLSGDATTVVTNRTTIPLIETSHKLL